MTPKHPILRLLATVPLLLALAAGGCGEERTQEPGASRAPDEPGSPDGAGPLDARAVLGRLRDRIERGEGNSGPSYRRDAEAAAAVLWGAPADAQTPAAARVHAEVCTISGEVCRWLAASPAARAERSATHPHDVAIHDAHLRALAGAPEAYKAWCAGEGARALAALKEARYRSLFPPR